MADPSAARFIGKRVENEHGMVGVIFDVSATNVFISYVRYRPDDEPGMYWLAMPIEGLEPATPPARLACEGCAFCDKMTSGE